MGCYRLLPICYVLLICGLSSGQMGLERTPFALQATRNRLDLQKLLAHQLTAEDLLRLGMNGTVINSRKYEGVKEPCKSHVTLYENSYKYGQMWAMYMYDSYTKIPESVLMGSSSHYGNFEECIDVRDVEAQNGSTFHGKYCIAIVNLRPKITSKATVSAAGLGPLKLGACVPSSCDGEDTALIVQEDFMERLQTVSPMFGFVEATASVPDVQCQTKQDFELDTADWLVTSLLIVIGVLVILSTAYDFYTLHSESRINLLLAFSVYTNGSKLFAMSTSRSGSTIHCLHGIRFFSMAWVILGHRYGAAINAPSINLLSYMEIVSDWKYLGVTNATLSVDTFLVLSGLLVGYMFFQKVPKTNSFNLPMYYIHRFIRLTPALAIVLLLQISLLRYAGSGPLWSVFQNLLKTNCEDNNWWINLLYVQNYVEQAVDKPCVNQAWYLAMDMQLFWVSPLVLVPLWKWPKIGLGLSGALTIAGIISNFVVSYVNELSATTLKPHAKDGADYGKLLYNPSHARFIPYLLGILLGYLLVELNSRKITIKFRKVVALLLWLVTGGLLLLTLCIVHVFLQPDYEFDNVSAAFYNALGRPGWGLGVAMVIFLCHTGHGGVIDSFLSWAWFQPLSRLTYSMYLTHLSVIMVHSSSVQTVMYLSDDNIMRQYFGDLIISILLGIVLSLTFESPFMVLEQELLSGRRKKITASTEPLAVVRTSESKDEQAHVDVPEETLPKEKPDV
ncbi:nose resistant to fluoxetine protein 6 isoform X2 [Anabrus simplex]|uniref:nose resistant to fluoxetine protein 6 isoform X2 n=1 Tax=Anabrus simplex TaxID=316456 RepID=UPI0035A290D2